MSTLPVSEGFIIAMFGGFGALVSGILVCCLRSRCTSIKFCGVECQRDVIPPDQLDAAQVNIAPPRAS